MEILPRLSQSTSFSLYSGFFSFTLFWESIFFWMRASDSCLLLTLAFSSLSFLSSLFLLFYYSALFQASSFFGLGIGEAFIFIFFSSILRFNSSIPTWEQTYLIFSPGWASSPWLHAQPFCLRISSSLFGKWADWAQSSSTDIPARCRLQSSPDKSARFSTRWSAATTETRPSDRIGLVPVSGVSWTHLLRLRYRVQ